MVAEDGYYLTNDTVMKRNWLRFDHGRNTEVYEEKTGICLCKIFLQRWDCERKQSYEYFVHLTKQNTIAIGQENFCQIKLKDLFLKHRWMQIGWEEGYFWVDGNTGEVFKNGQVCERKSRIREHDFLEIGGYRFYFFDEKLFFDSTEGIECHGILIKRRKIERSDYPDYVCRARWSTPYPEEEIHMITPENFPAKTENRIFLSLFSSMGMIGMMFLFQRQSGFLGGIYRIAMGMMAAVTAVVSWIYGKIHTLHRQKRYIRRYRDYLRKKEEEVAKKRIEERDFLEKQERSWEELFQEVENYSWKLFEKSAEDWDFLCVRMGRGEILPRTCVKFQRKEELIQTHTLWEEAQKMVCRQNKIEDAPILFDLPAFGVSGIVGEESVRIRFLEMILFEVVCSHSEDEVKILLWGDEKTIWEMRWLRFLPHVQTKMKERWIGWGKESRIDMAKKLERELERRKAEKRKSPAWIVCFLREEEEEIQPFFQKISEAVSEGIYSLFLREDERELPKGCSGKICLDTMKTGINNKKEKTVEGKVFVRGWKEERKFCTNFPEKEVFFRAAKILSVARKKEEACVQKLPQKLTLFELFEQTGEEIWNLKKRWGKVRKTLPVPIGLREDGSVFYLDLHEKADGAHGLIAGTTGSGKSEMMLTYLLMAAMFFPPWRMQFLLIDFKGGGLANYLKGIPHLAGIITNLDEISIERSLSFIRAELKKRQRMLAQFQCMHVDEYAEIYEKRPQECEAMPHLVLIVDEFAELKAEQPEFMKELISASRIGRSLGVHLILATQKPSGQVSEQIWSNTRFRMCLKVQSENDSREVLHSPLAAQIKEAGRGYFQVGNQEQFVLFQSAYSSEKIKEEREEGFQIFRILMGGERELFYEKEEKVIEGQTQAEMVRQWLTDQWEKEYKRTLPTVCLEPLREEIFYPYGKERTMEKWNLPIGIYDDPQGQRQPEALLDMKQQNLLVIGGIGAGKQNLFFVLLRGLIAQNVEGMEIYIADFGGRIPQILENLPQVGGIIHEQEEEKLENLIEMMQDEMKFRRQKRELEIQEKKMEFEITPVFMVWFSYTEWRKKYPDLEARILAIWREGIRLGIYTILFQEEISGLGNGALSGFGCRIALYHQDGTVYRQMMDSARGKLPRIPGRGFFQKENHVYQMQTYLAFRGTTKKEQILKMEDWIWESCKNTKKMAKKIPCVPEKLLWESYPVFRRKGQVPVAVKFERVRTVFWEQWRKKITGICGEGQEKWIAQIPDAWKIFQEKVKLFILDDDRETLRWMAQKEEVFCYTKEREELLGALRCALRHREEEEIVWILNGMSVVTELSQDEIFPMICELSKEMVILCTNLENKAIRYQSPKILQEIKERGQIIFFGEKKEMKVVEAPFGQLKKCKERKDKSEVFFWDGVQLEKWKVPMEVCDSMR